MRGHGAPASISGESLGGWVAARVAVNQLAATTGNDLALDTLIPRLHIETSCRRGGALALRPADLDSDQCLILLREKGDTTRWQPVSPTHSPGSPASRIHLRHTGPAP